MSKQHKRLPLVLDWDGTVTEVDSLHMLIEHFGDLEVFLALDAEVGRSLTLDEVIEAEMATVQAPYEEVRDWLLAHVRVRPGFRELVAQHDPLIVSAGFHETIEPILAREGIEARLVANHVGAHEDGWRATFAAGTACDTCSERCKRSAVAELGPYVYVGDGVSDRCVSLAAERRFARDGLARWLAARGVEFEPFDDMHDVAAALEGGDDSEARAST